MRDREREGAVVPTERKTKREKKQMLEEWKDRQRDSSGAKGDTTHKPVDL